MRRKDREITDSQAMLEILDQCSILRIGLADGDFPYIVPLNFAYAVEDGRLAFYVHGAMAGRKYELMRKNGVCSFETDRPLKVECLPEKRGITMRYQSIMGTAEIQFLEGEEKQRAMNEIFLPRFPEAQGFSAQESALKHTGLARLTVLTWTAKVNPLSSGEEPLP